MSASVLYDSPGPKALARYRMIGIVSIIVFVLLAVLVVWKLWSEEQLTADKWEPFVTPGILDLLLAGLWATVKTAVFAIIGALAFGVIFGVGKLSDHAWVRWPCWLVVEFFRAVPLLMLIIFLWSLYKFSVGNIWPLVLGLILYNGSVLAEVFRAGINAVPRGQGEAAYALGMRKTLVMRMILLPQAVKIMTPALISQCIVVLKDTSLGYYIVAPGLTFAGREIWRTFDNRFATALVLALVYIVLNLILEYIGRIVQQRVSGARPATALKGETAAPIK